MARGPDSASTWGAVMETGYPNGVASLVCLRDGTTSLYTSTGGGIIGGGAHDPVVRANHALLATIEATWAAWPRAPITRSPPKGA